MKALKACVVVAGVGLLLAGCGGGEWSGEVRFKVTQITPGKDLVSGQKGPGRVSLELDQEQPSSQITSPWAHQDQVPSDVKVGDKVVCTVKKRDDSKLDDAEAVQTITSCRKA